MIVDRVLVRVLGRPSAFRVSRDVNVLLLIAYAYMHMYRTNGGDKSR